MITILDNIISEKIADRYKEQIERHFTKMIALDFPYDAFHPTRTLSLSTNDRIVLHVKKTLEDSLKVNLTCYQAELQAWPVGEESELHVHTGNGRETLGGDFNSMLYLNDDFAGGEFYTNNGLILKPKKGRLTFFNGVNTHHGVKKVLDKHRYTIIFWWVNTKFY